MFNASLVSMDAGPPAAYPRPSTERGPPPKRFAFSAFGELTSHNVCRHFSELLNMVRGKKILDLNFIIGRFCKKYNLPRAKREKKLGFCKKYNLPREARKKILRFCKNYNIPREAREKNISDFVKNITSPQDPSLRGGG